MLLRFRVLPLVFVISLLSGCGLASKAFYSAGDKLFQPEMTPSLRCRRIQCSVPAAVYSQPGEGQQRLSG
ncbi:lipoprotein [Klebsiella pneumoniae]|uniref:Lipoprotein n=1 Tax=Klebsiella pneumoniae TaxID=573 RepID=A0A377VX84_KLEPN|nr:lipoprotein [Klebsiella pneumoniae]